jgi:hypothetical protein
MFRTIFGIIKERNGCAACAKIPWTFLDFGGRIVPRGGLNSMVSKHKIKERTSLYMHAW